MVLYLARTFETYQSKFLFVKSTKILSLFNIYRCHHHLVHFITICVIEFKAEITVMSINYDDGMIPLN